MKQRLLILVLVLTLPLIGQAQKVNFSQIGLRASYIDWEGKKFMYGIGPTVHIYLGDHIVLNYHIQFGADHHKNFHVHSYLGGATSIFLALSGLEDDAKKRELKLFGALIAAFIPEGIGYTAKITDNVYLTPYINPLGFHIASNAHFSGELGGRLEYRMGRFSLAPYLTGEVMTARDMERIGDLTTGLGAGVSLTYQVNE